MIKAVVFDLDNTVYDYDKCNQIATDKLQNTICNKYNMSAEEFKQRYEYSKKSVKNQLGNTGASHNRLLYLQNFLEELDRLPAYECLELYDIYWDCMLQHMILYPYVIPLISKLKESSIRIGVLTDLTAHIQHRKIRKLGLDKYIEKIVTSEEAGAEKPSERAFVLIQKKFNLATSDILMIGDSAEKDLEGAIKAGMHGLLFKPEHSGNMIDICMEYIYGRIY